MANKVKLLDGSIEPIIERFSDIEPVKLPRHTAAVMEKCKKEQQAKAQKKDNSQNTSSVTSKEALTQESPAYVCSDGRIVELAINPDSQRVDYIVFDPKTGNIMRTDRVQNGSITYVPPNGASGLCTTGFGVGSGAVLLPTEPMPYESEETLIAEVREYIHSYVELGDSEEAIATHYVLFTWVSDKFDEVPYVRFFTPDIGCGKSRGLETVGTICYRPIMVGGSSSAASLRRIIDSYHGTLVGDEQDCKGDRDLTSTYIKMLNQGFQRGKPILVCDGGKDKGYTPRKFEVFGPKVVVTRTKFNDEALESRFLTIRMRARTRDDVPLNLPRKEFDKRALTIRNKLLQYRFDHYHDVSLNASLSVPGIEDRLNQIGIPLLSTITNESSRLRVVESLKVMNSELAEERADSIPGLIVEYLSRKWPDSTAEVYIKDLTKYLNGDALQGDSITYAFLGKTLHEREVGQVVRSKLGLKTKRKNDGFIVVRDMKRLEELKRKYGISGAPSGQRSQPSQSSLSGRPRL